MEEESIELHKEFEKKYVKEIVMELCILWKQILQ